MFTTFYFTLIFPHNISTVFSTYGCILTQYWDCFDSKYVGYICAGIWMYVHSVKSSHTNILFVVKIGALVKELLEVALTQHCCI